MEEKVKARSFDCVLQESIEQRDKSWSYEVSGLPSDVFINHNRLVKSVSVISDARNQHIKLRLESIPMNRVTSTDTPSSFVLLSFKDFRLYLPSNSEANAKERATAKESANYVCRLLQSGISINNVHYNFYGHSNSQLKSRSCLMFAGSTKEISKKIEAMGDFSKINSVAKKAKRLGLLFSTADAAVELPTDRCEDVPDIQTGNFIFTDGCGQIAPRLAKTLSKNANITFRNKKYIPSVFQIRYRGYKGVLSYEPTLASTNFLVKFRNSMKKFSGGVDMTLSIVDYSKPYARGHLNDEIILLLHALGISREILLHKQTDYLQFLQKAKTDPITAFELCTWANKLDVAERILMEGIEVAQTDVKKIVQKELNSLLNKRDEQRCRILVPRSRLLFGICDPYGVLKEGECFVRITATGDGAAHTLENADVLVARNPCLHPGDLQKFKSTANQKLTHLVDCIVFPVKGKRPSADLMSGGDLDGDKFFVCWDPDLVPASLSEPAEYPGAKEKVVYRQISDHDRLVYFANFHNASLGRIKNLYLDWARAKGPLSVECQELNRLFSQCVDGNNVREPSHLKELPKTSNDDEKEPFILDFLHDAAKRDIHEFTKTDLVFDSRFHGYNFGAVQMLLSRESLPMSEFELIEMTLRWCRERGTSFEEFLAFFDFQALTDLQKTWLLNSLPLTKLAAPVMNGLLHSEIVEPVELTNFQLDHPTLHWKKLFSSSTQRLETLMSNISRALELFHKKLIVLSLDERFSVLIYIPQQLHRQRDCKVGTFVRVFALPRSNGRPSCNYRVVPTKLNYRLYCDDSTFQLFDEKRGNTFIYLVHGPLNDSSYRSTKDTGDRRRKKQETFEQGLNSACRASIALDKISKDIQTHVGRVNRTEIRAAEIFVISNRDINSLRTLDLWLEHIDTQKVIPVFDTQPREYNTRAARVIDWENEELLTTRVVKDGDLDSLKECENIDDLMEVLRWMLKHSSIGKLRDVFQYVLNCQMWCSFSKEKRHDFVISMGRFVAEAPFFILSLMKSDLWEAYSADYDTMDDVEKINALYVNMLKSAVISMNDMGVLAVESFECVLNKCSHMDVKDFVHLVRLIALVVHSTDLAMDLLVGAMEKESVRILNDQPHVISNLVKGTIGIALDHIDEFQATKAPKQNEFLNLSAGNVKNGDTHVAQMRLRIDSTLPGILKTGDHVRLVAATPPTNAPVSKKASLDGLVSDSADGKVTLQCFQTLPSFVEDCSWSLRGSVSFVTSDTMFNAIEAFYTEQEKACPVFDALTSCYRFDSEKHNHAQVPSIGEYHYPELNTSQNKAVRVAESARLCLIWGPPGTGKTFTIAAMLKRALERDPPEKILVSAPTHNAVDNLLRKFLSVTKHISDEKDVLRVTTNVQRVSSDLRAYTCDAMFDQDINENYTARRKALKRVKDSRIVFTTCIGSGIGLLRGIEFNTVFVDEASQQTEPASLVPLVKGASRVILVGDHVQLRATVQLHAVTQEFDISLFERLYNSSDHVIDIETSTYKVLLDTQYRMHADISSFSSREFYNGRIMTAVKDDERPITLSKFPWMEDDRGIALLRKVFINCDSSEDIGRKSKSNKGQAELCKEICRLLRTSTDGVSSVLPYSITILSPYTRQVEILSKMIPEVPVATVDGFQGRESDIIIFCTVRCNAHADRGFLNDLRRLNVAVTRPKAALIVVGDQTTLTAGGEESSANPGAVWNRLIDSCARVNLFPLQSDASE